MNPPVYDPRFQKWLFQRQPHSERTQQFYPVTEACEQVLRPVPATSDKSSTAATANGSYRKKKWEKYVIEDAPHAAAALPIVTGMLEESKLVEVTTETTDMDVGTVLAFGAATAREDREGGKGCKVVGWVGGKTSGDLMLSEMGLETRSINGSSSLTLQVPKILDPHLPPAYRFTSPIRQIIFGSNPYHLDSQNPRVAVRTAGATKIFKLRQTQHPPRGHKSRLVLQPLVTLVPDASGGKNEHAHVAFNPYYARNFAVMDMKGDWKAWDIQGSYVPYKRGSGITVVLSASGSLRDGNDDESKGDGWGKVCWGAESTSILACDRHRAALFDIRQSPPAKTVIKFPVDRGRSWILDFQKPPMETSKYDAFMLTSSDLVWVDLRYPKKPLMAIPHRRHRDDVSLHLEILEVNSVMTAFIGSRLNSILSTYQLARSYDINQMATHIGDPYSLSAPYYQDTPSSGSLTTTFLPCDLQALDDSLFDDTHDATYMLGISLNKQYGITQRVYSTNPEKTSFSIVQTTNKVRNIKSADFVDSEGSTEEEIDVERNSTFPGKYWVLEGKARRVYEDMKKTRALELAEIFETHKRFDLRRIYKLAFIDTEDGLKTAASGDGGEHSAEGYQQRLENDLERRVERRGLGISSLLEILPPERLFDDITSFEGSIHTLLQQSPLVQSSYHLTHHLPRTSILPTLPPPDPTDPSPNAATTTRPITTVYNHLLTTRLHPLPSEVPNRVRLRRERLARLIATDHFLSSVGLSIVPDPEAIKPPPVKPGQMGYGLYLQSLQSRESQSYPLSQFQSQTDSEENNEGDSLFPSLPPEPLHRIRHYAPLQTRLFLSPGLQSVLDTWVVGSDPNSESSNTTIPSTNPDDGVPRYQRDRIQQRREKERLREERRAEKRAERGVSLASQISRGSGFGASQPVVVQAPRKVMGGTATQIDGDGVGQAQSQSPARGPGVMMSQVERGRHGARPMVKKRRTGF